MNVSNAIGNMSAADRNARIKQQKDERKNGKVKVYSPAEIKAFIVSQK